MVCIFGCFDCLCLKSLESERKDLCIYNFFCIYTKLYVSPIIICKFLFLTFDIL